MKPLAIVVIRGHVRNSFDTYTLHDFVKELSDMYELEIYIHTWNVKQTSMSWRQIDDDLTKITDNFVRAYFKDLGCNIKEIIIEDDSTIDIIGKSEGNVGNTRTPLLGWKRYIHGQFKVLKHVHDTRPGDSFIINTRFDLFSCSYVFPSKDVVEFAKNSYKDYARILFLKQGEYCGVDNIIIGTVKNMYNLIEYIHENLDDFLEKNQDLKHPEYVIPMANLYLENL